jgi:hypothetical protein
MGSSATAEKAIPTSRADRAFVRFGPLMGCTDFGSRIARWSTRTVADPHAGTSDLPGTKRRGVR